MNTSPELLAGQEALEHKRLEYAFNHPGRKPTTLARIATERQIIAKPEPVITHKDPADDLRIDPLVMLAAIKSRQDIAARTWFICRNLDFEGKGWIFRAALSNYLKAHNIGERQRRRWIRVTLGAGLLAEGEHGKYRIISSDKAAEILGAEEKGYPVLIPTRLLLKRSWHAYAWAGYLATRGKNPISQVKLAELTGIATRTQKKYQKQAPVNKQRNYVKTDLDQTHLTGMREYGRPSAFVGYQKRIYFRLPDNIEVPESMAKRPPKRANGDNQKKPSKLLVTNGQDKCELIRLFHLSLKSAKAAERKTNKLDRYPWNKPQELFIKQAERQTYNVWTMYAIN